ncbi:hypothetical protein M3Y98_00829400 [Aphelenchoides besseyi]|nr:hypothetical protein M3Y98_00829400 [Aphelenchoides besseyi]KAI6195404.1 hypothetical protein M3Y96_01227700 [Aphelenchoides besseyi]
MISPVAIMFIFYLVSSISASIEIPRFRDDQVMMLEKLVDYLPEHSEVEEDEEMVYSMKQMIEETKARAKIERAKTPMELLETSVFYYMRSIASEYERVILPGKFITLEYDSNDSREFAVYLQFLITTAIGWKVPKTRKDYIKVIEDQDFEGKNIGEIVENGIVMLTDFYGMSLEELNIYETEEAANNARIEEDKEEAFMSADDLYEDGKVEETEAHEFDTLNWHGGEF